jgi:hypothetical protein
LVCGVDCFLRDGERVLAGFRDEGAYGRILLGGGEYDIADGAHTWDHVLNGRPSGEQIYEFVPFHVRPGGHILGSGLRVTVAVPPFREYWLLRSESGWRVRARPRNVRSEGSRAFHQKGKVIGHEIHLDEDPRAEASFDVLPLAFACWIVRQEDLVPVTPGVG